MKMIEIPPCLLSVLKSFDSTVLTTELSVQVKPCEDVLILWQTDTYALQSAAAVNLSAGLSQQLEHEQTEIYWTLVCHIVSRCHAHTLTNGHLSINTWERLTFLKSLDSILCSTRLESTGTSPVFRFGIMEWEWLRVTNWTSHYHSDSFKVSFIMFYLNMVDYPVSFPFLSTLTWDTFLTRRGRFQSEHYTPIQTL